MTPSRPYQAVNPPSGCESKRVSVQAASLRGLGARAEKKAAKKPVRRISASSQKTLDVLSRCPSVATYSKDKTGRRGALLITEDEFIAATAEELAETLTTRDSGQARLFLPAPADPVPCPEREKDL